MRLKFLPTALFVVVLAPCAVGCSKREAQPIETTEQQRADYMKQVTADEE